MAAVEPDRLRPKIHHIRERLRRLREIEGGGWERFEGDPLLQDAAVRNLQTSIEAVLDMANHIVARGGLGTPVSYRETIELMVEAGVLPHERAGAFRAMVSFRNRAVHLYDEIDAEEVYAILENDLGDFEVFIAAIVERYLGEE
ncbi:MAG TPA: DUF86 domain-containing protein [Longimicrobiales bacterium]|jgi:uncharacterized protein YutE (UPF0331/DUF86 family)|nr:DUF86 domain-containing protein [Longimicrobiales bacterium]